mgnify:CR=1 FL=1
MCGIVGVLGNHEVAPLLVEALKRLEYRGYDSAGIATIHDGVMDRRLADRDYLAGDYSIADIATWPWYGATVKGLTYEAGEFLSVHEYTHVIRWADEIAKRPAVQRGRMVNRATGPLEHQLHERHDASDFDTRTQDKLQGK